MYASWLMPSRARLAVVYPTLADPRWLQLAFLFAFVVYAINSPGFVRGTRQFVLGVLVSVVLDASLSYYRRRVLIAPMSGLISSMGLLLVCDSPVVWIYPLIGAVTILSKHLITFRGRHIFNPLNFGVVVGLQLFSDRMTVLPGRWGGSFAGLAAVASLGVLTVYRARRLDVSITYALTFLAGALARSLYAGSPFLTEAAPATGAAFMLFSLFMITDPMTTRPTRRGRVLAAIALGAIEAVLWQVDVLFAPFYAAFVIAALAPLLPPRIRPGQEEAPVWKPRVVQLLGGPAPGP